MAYYQSKNMWIQVLADGVANLVLDAANRNVNVFNRQVFDEFEQALDKVEHEEFELLIIRSGKPGRFCAGADLKAMPTNATPDDFRELSALGQRAFQRLADLDAVSVAVISGACLGGGLELALACDYRVVVANSATQIGFPELEVGLIPGWGGTQRLPRLIGIQQALPMILGGRRLNADEALAWGLADDIAEENDDKPPDFLDEPKKRPIGDFPKRTWRHRWVEANRLGRWLIFRGARRVLNRKAPDDMPAPWEALEAVKVGVREGMDKGLEYERDAIGRLSESLACRNLVRLFMQREEARKKVLPEKKTPAIRRVGIVDTGSLAMTILQWVVHRGGEVVVREGSEMALGLAVLRIAALLQKSAEQGVLSDAEVQRRLANVHGTTKWKGFADLDLVVETHADHPERKAEWIKQIEENVAPSTMIATATCGMTISDIVNGLQKPHRLVGLHFCHPPASTPVVEVVATEKTNKQVLDEITDWLRLVGKIPVVVPDVAGFVVNRVLLPYWYEAANLLVEGHRIQDIDAAMHRFGMVVGPFKYLDSWGIDSLVRCAQFADDEEEVHRIWRLMVQNQWLGEKTRKGFYRHGRRRKPNGQLSSKIRSAFGPPPRREPMSVADEYAMITDRLIGVLVNEAADVWADGVVKDWQTLDWVLVFAGGWAPHRGGPFRYVLNVGVEQFVEKLRALAKKCGERYEPHPVLLEIRES